MTTSGQPSVEHALRRFLEAHNTFELNVRQHLAAYALEPRLSDRWKHFAPRAAPWPCSSALRRRLESPSGAVATTKEQLSRRLAETPSVDIGDDNGPWVRPTSGTSGPRLMVPYSSPFFFWFKLYSQHAAAHVAGLEPRTHRPDDVSCLALIDHKEAPEQIWAAPRPGTGITVQCVYDERTPDSARRVSRLIESLKPTILSTKPNILASLVHRRVESSAERNWVPALVLSSGSSLDETLRSQTEEVLGAPVVDSYGLTEFGSVATECWAHDGLHIYGEGLVAEVRHLDGSVRASGHGELLLTSEANARLPLDRYRTGDNVDLTYQRCRCGFEGYTLYGLEGRYLRNLVLSDGSEYALPNLFTLLAAVTEFEVSGDARRLAVRVQLRDATDVTNQVHRLRQRLRDEFRGLLVVDLDVTTDLIGQRFERFQVEGCTTVDRSP